jgi:hypothetical protein
VLESRVAWGKAGVLLTFSREEDAQKCHDKRIVISLPKTVPGVKDKALTCVFCEPQTETSGVDSTHLILPLLLSRDHVGDILAPSQKVLCAFDRSTRAFQVQSHGRSQATTGDRRHGGPPALPERLGSAGI